MSLLSKTKPTTVLMSLLMGLVLMGMLSGCGNQQPAPVALVGTPSIGEPKVGAPSPQQPGEEIGISIEIASTGGVTLNYVWTADGGEIVRGQDSPAITYRVPDEPGTYNVRVMIEWDGQSVEKVTSIKVEIEATETPTPLPPTDTPTSKPPTNTPVLQPTDTPTSEPTDTPEPTPEPTQIPPTNTPVPAVPTAIPTPISPIIFQDDFDNALADGWNIVREVATHWSLTDAPGSWRVILQPGGLTNIDLSPNNLLLRAAPGGNFEIAALVHFTPTSNFQFAGLLIYQDESNAMQFGRAFCDVADTCADNGIYFDNIQSGEFTGDNYQ